MGRCYLDSDVYMCSFLCSNQCWNRRFYFAFLSSVFECVMYNLKWYAGWCGVTMSISSMPCILWRGSGAQHDVVCVDPRVLVQTFEVLHYLWYKDGPVPLL
jgi:hypothetical protein